MRSLPKLIPGIHPKLPGDSQDQVKRIFAHAEEHSIELNLYIKGEEADEDAPVPEAEATPEAAVEPEPDESTPAEPDETAASAETGDAESKGPTQGGEHGQADPGPSESGKPGQGGAA